MVWPVIGAVVGGLMANKSAKADRASNERMNEANMAGFRQYEPYVDAGLSGGQGAFNDALAGGYYQGPTLAGPNNMQNTANNAMYNFGMGNMATGQGMMASNAGFGANAQGLYGQFNNLGNQISGRTGQFDDMYSKNIGLADDYRGNRQQIGDYQGQFDALTGQSQGITDRFGALADRANEDRIGAANDYAVNNANPLVDAMLRDDRRALEEGTLPGINMGASGSGNTNSSRAGIASAVAQRGFADREADVRSDVVKQLRDAKLAQDNAQFGQAMDATGSMGTSMANTGAFLGNAVGNIGNQAAMTGNMGGAYGNASNAATNAVNNIGNVGVQFGNAANVNNQISGAFNTGTNLAANGGNMAFGAGTNQQGFDQTGLNDDRANFEGNRDFGYNMYKDYMGGMLGRAPTTNNNTQANMVNPQTATLGGMMTGFGMMNPNNAMYNNMFGFQPGQFSVV